MLVLISKYVFLSSSYCNCGGGACGVGGITGEGGCLGTCQKKQEPGGVCWGDDNVSVYRMRDLMMDFILMHASSLLHRMNVNPITACAEDALITMESLVIICIAMPTVIVRVILFVIVEAVDADQEAAGMHATEHVSQSDH